MGSEIAQLRAQLERELEGFNRGFSGYAAVASHDAINNKYNNIGVYQDALEQLVGLQEAAQIVCETYIRVVG